MLPFEYVILFFGICLLHALLQTAYDTGREAGPADQVFLVPEGFRQFGIFPSPFNRKSNFIEKLEPLDEVTIPTTVPLAAAAFFDDDENEFEKVDWNVTKQTFIMTTVPLEPKLGGFLIMDVCS